MWVVHDIYTKRILTLITFGWLVASQSLAQFRMTGSVGLIPNTVCINEKTDPNFDACNEPVMFFDDTAPVGTTGWQWNFGDALAIPLTNNISYLQNPRHQYTQVGLYTVLLTRTSSSGPPINVFKNIQVSKYSKTRKPLFNKKEKSDTTVCAGKTVKLDPFDITQLNPAPSGVSYLWSPKGETTSTLTVTESGCYSVEVTDNVTGCKKMAQITVKFCLKPAPQSGGAEIAYVGNQAGFSIKETILYKKRDTTLVTGNVFGEPEDSLRVKSIAPETGNPMNTVNSTAMVYNSKGEIAFMTDGRTIYDKDKVAIGTISSGSLTATTPALIVPKYTCNECPHIMYHVLSYDAARGQMSYSIIDTRLNNGKGAISEKDIPMATNISEKIAYGYNQNKDGMYIITHQNGNAIYQVTKIDSMGIASDYTFSLGEAWDTPESQKGFMRMSLKGEKIVAVVTKGGKNYLEVLRLSINPGDASPVLSLEKTIDMGANPPTINGIEFSPSEDFIYITTNKPGESKLIQIDIDTEQKVDIHTSTGPMGDIRLTPIGDIEAIGQAEYYLAISVPGSNLINYLKTPNSRGKAFVGFNDDSPTKVGANIGALMGWGLSNIVKVKQDNENDGIQVTYKGNCEGGTTEFTLQPVCSPMKTKAVWDFGDGSPTAEGTTVTHKYKDDGKYPIKVTITISEDVVKQDLGQISTAINKVFRDECTEISFDDFMYVMPGPEINLPKEVFICEDLNEVKTLDANPTNDPDYIKFAWILRGAPPITTRTINVDTDISPASLFVTNKYNCEVKHNFEVLDKCEPLILAPNAFTPNNDGEHEKFVIDARFVTDYELSIFNRWGELIFNTIRPDTFWDGSYKNNGNPEQIYGPYTYAYVIKYRSQDFPQRGIETKRGAVMVLK